MNESNLYSPNLQLETVKVPINKGEPLKLELTDFLSSTVTNNPTSNW